METPRCASCLRPKGVYQCGLCQNAVCKKCAHFLKVSSLCFLEKIPEICTHETYCDSCYAAKVSPIVEDYHRTMEAAKAVMVFSKTQVVETRWMRRSEKAFRVVDCDDEKETLLRLAFFAAKANFNALVDVDIHFRKVRNFAYQTTKWDGTGVPTNIDPKKLKS